MFVRQILRWAIPATVLILIGGSASALLAEAPAADIPSGVQNESCDLVTLEPGASKWYPIFNHPGLSLEVTLRANGLPGLGFSVYTQEQYNTLADGNVKPIGVGSPNKNELGHDLTWEGRYPYGGPYYVQVTNTSPFPRTYRLCSYERDWTQPPAPAAPEMDCAAVCATLGEGWVVCPVHFEELSGPGVYSPQRVAAPQQCLQVGSCWCTLVGD